MAKKRKTTKATRGKTSRKPIYFLIILIVAIASMVGWQYLAGSNENDAKPLSRRVLEIGEEQVRNHKPPPTLTALQYAYVTSAYADGLAVGGQEGALYTSEKILGILYPDAKDQINSGVAELASSNKLHRYGSDAMVPAGLEKVVKKYTARYQNDGHDLKWDGHIPTGKGKWYMTSDVEPFTPRAGEWKRWVVTKTIPVPPPPLYGSQEDLRQLQITREASANRTGEDVNIINFWGGTPGTNGPSGIWQDQLYSLIGSELPSNKEQADMKYSQIQKIVAQGLSDSFMECWKVKYKYWTARPDMRDPSIKTAMKDPNFPSYISGHSTISKTAADIIAQLAPKHANEAQAMALEARNSRLKAGIHFEIDNKVGFKVGTAVAKQYIQKLNLEPIL